MKTKPFDGGLGWILVGGVGVLSKSEYVYLDEPVMLVCRTRKDAQTLARLYWRGEEKLRPVKVRIAEEKR